MNTRKYTGDLSKLFSPDSRFPLFRKIGGSVMNSIEGMKYAVDLICSQKPKVLVLSTISGGTNQLERVFETCCDGDKDHAALLFDGFVEKHCSYAVDYNVSLDDSFFQTEKEYLFDVLFGQIQTNKGDEDKLKKIRDYIVGFGELATVYLFEQILQKKGVSTTQLDPVKLIKLKKDGFGEAGIDVEETVKLLGDAIVKHEESDCVILIPGFIAGQDGCRTTLGRNGSDTTLALASIAYFCKTGTPPLVSFVKKDTFEFGIKEGHELSALYKKWHFFLKHFKKDEQPYIYLDAIQLLLGDSEESKGVHKGPGFSLPFQIIAQDDPDFELRIVSCKQFRTLSLTQPSSVNSAATA